MLFDHSLGRRAEREKRDNGGREQIRNFFRKSRHIICLHSTPVVSPIRAYLYTGMLVSLQCVTFEKKIDKLKIKNDKERH
jgi:hypothetical protein